MNHLFLFFFLSFFNWFLSFGVYLYDCHVYMKFLPGINMSFQISASFWFIIEQMFLYDWWKENEFHFCFSVGVQARLHWNFNGSDRSSKSSSWREHLWFLAKEAAGNFIQLFICVTDMCMLYGMVMPPLFAVGNMGRGRRE